MREGERLAAATAVAPAAPRAVVAARTEHMLGVAAAAVAVRRRHARAHVVLMAARGCEPEDLAHDRGPLVAVGCDAAAVQAVGEQVTHLVRDRVAQEIRGIVLEQAAVEADDVAVGVRHRRRHAAQIEGETRALETALEMNFGAAVACLDGGLQERRAAIRRRRGQTNPGCMTSRSSS